MSIDAPETEEVTRDKVSCDGGASGHPRVWLQIPSERSWIECPYCDKRFVLKEGAKSGGH
jgi:uncharacterized Zn-finger protein